MFFILIYCNIQVVLDGPRVPEFQQVLEVPEGNGRYLMQGKLHWTMRWCHHRMLSEGYDDMNGLFILTLSPLSPLLPFWPVPPVSPCTESKALAKPFKSNQWAHLHQTYRSFSELSTLSPSSPGGPEGPAPPGSPAGPGCPSRPAGPTGPFSPWRISEKNINVKLRWEVLFVY